MWYNSDMYDVAWHVAYQRLIRENRAPALICPCEAQLFIKVTGDDVDYECWACGKTIILGLATIKSMNAYIKEDDERSRV